MSILLCLFLAFPAFSKNASPTPVVGLSMKKTKNQFLRVGAPKHTNEKNFAESVKDVKPVKSDSTYSSGNTCYTAGNLAIREGSAGYDSCQREMERRYVPSGFGTPEQKQRF